MTIDPITSDRIKLLHPAIRQQVLECTISCYNKNVPIRIIQGLRTIDQQNDLYAQGRTQEQLNAVGLVHVTARPDLPKVTNAKGGDSFHNFGLSIDFCLLRQGKQISWNRDEDIDNDGEKDWNEVVDTFLSKGFEWGGNWTSFPDYPHLQKTLGLTIRKAKELYAAKKLDSNGYLII